uniref:Crossover junction endonuclease MUS81 n=1 Tax=Angiostrongylus cantonensis TaxID=6313 RepID=A0A158P8N2_ANGCA
MSKCRVKVRVEHMQKTFYERLLHVWRQQTEDKNQKFVIYKAYVNLKNYPLEVRTVADLKHIHGLFKRSRHVILIADSRENNSKSIVQVEMRPLSVGDYLWVLRKIDGTELVLEWIVERKTWNDLHQSIRSGRYEEQKQRLCRSPMKNRVYLIEGPQALATTLVSDGFMIQRSKNPQDSAYFLCRLTEYLKTKTASSQNFSKRLMWKRAQIVARRFPSFVSMLRLYRQDGASKSDAALSSAVPEVNSILNTVQYSNDED